MVNFTDQNFPRIPKFSSHYYRQLITDNGFVSGYPGPSSLSTSEVELETGTLYGKFPDDFLFATGTAAYQTEGAWNESGKSISLPRSYTKSRTYSHTFSHTHVNNKD